MLEKGPAEANAFLADPAKYLEALKSQSDAAVRSRLVEPLSAGIRRHAQDIDHCGRAAAS
jgi:hypothetical protein